jgi:N-acetylglucosaminylphosphatidylinositol deacetylase
MPRPQLWTPLLVACFALVAFYIFQDPKPVTIDSDSRILLLTAHPDDECFFFAPTLLSLSAGTDKLYSLTVSNGMYCYFRLINEP